MAEREFATSMVKQELVVSFQHMIFTTGVKLLFTPIDLMKWSLKTARSQTKLFKLKTSSTKTTKTFVVET